LKATSKDVLKACKSLQVFTVNVSSYNYKDHQLLVGTILIKENDEIYLTVSNNKDYSIRDAEKNPDYNCVIFLDDKRIKHINGLSDIIDYIKEKHLEDYIVEFAVFNIKLGIKKEQVIIYEIRTDY
jgi:hypothetical protein